MNCSQQTKTVQKLHDLNIFFNIGQSWSIYMYIVFTSYIWYIMRKYFFFFFFLPKSIYQIAIIQLYKVLTTNLYKVLGRYCMKALLSLYYQMDAYKTCIKTTFPVINLCYSSIQETRKLFFADWFCSIEWLPYDHSIMSISWCISVIYIVCVLTSIHLT